ncbi:MAG: bifunctional uroporphyrinogen-III C-methyltransferase/uroporphyrinogen-III synthase, partial [Actinobacteria bacterium]|nr:bifunctional uroporphyrinogen-III C-methyltransferase/uroporphyrinogen-III synthase [Actinomycetota bacterium]
TSSSTVRNLVGIAGKPHAASVIACIGPATAKTAQEHGLRVDVLPEEPTMAALVKALAAHGMALREEAASNGAVGWRPSRKRSASRRRAT